MLRRQNASREWGIYAHAEVGAKQSKGHAKDRKLVGIRVKVVIVASVVT
jgi:hypothetical protein